MFPPERLPPGENIFRLRASRVRQPDASPSSTDARSDSRDSLSVLGFSDINPNTSLGIFRAVEATEPTCFRSPPLQKERPHGCWEWYKVSLRQLPSPMLIDELSTAFFNKINWQYSPLDLDIFMEQKACWEQLPYSELAKGPEALAPHSRFFPAILFQLLPLALIHRDSKDMSFESLKYKADMSLDDLAREYSDAGAALLSSLGKDDLPISAVQAGFLRTLFLKTTGRVLDSWHSLGETIENARMLQWHLDVVPDERVVQSVQDWWHSEVCRRTYVLELCDC
jgi:hypothetical protein